MKKILWHIKIKLFRYKRTTLNLQNYPTIPTSIKIMISKTDLKIIEWAKKRFPLKT